MYVKNAVKIWVKYSLGEEIIQSHYKIYNFMQSKKSVIPENRFKSQDSLLSLINMHDLCITVHHVQ